MLAPPTLSLSFFFFPAPPLCSAIAALRAVSDALRHSSLNFFAATGKTVHDMHVEVRIAVARPDLIDVDAVAAAVPYGTVTVTPVAGGLDVEAPSGDDGIVIANAAILVSVSD